MCTPKEKFVRKLERSKAFGIGFVRSIWLKKKRIDFITIII